MEINPSILEIFKEFKIHPDDGLGYLFALHFNYRPTYIPDAIRAKVNATKIIEHNGKDYKWNVPLFKGAEVAFQWVADEYIPMFKEANPDRGGKVRESTARMKKFFANNPHRRKDEVLEATRMYLLNTDSRYIMMPHYFIEKGVGASKTYALEDWLEKYDLSQSDHIGRESMQNTMQ